MQDKEFDELFRSKLDDLEAEPSVSVWTGIESGLASGSRKKYLLPLLGIAASILILVTAGVLFMQRGAKTGTNQHQKPIAKTIHPLNNIHKNDVSPVVPKTIVDKQINNTAFAANRIYKSHPVKVSTKQPVNVSPEHKVETEQPTNTNEQNVLATVQSNKPDVVKPVVPDESTPLIAKQLTDEPAVTIAKPVLVSAQLPVAKQLGTPAKQKRRIKSLGDLINVVVAKVDKRKDKIIEFTDTDDDESMITGVNLGIIKLKKDK